MKMTKSSKKWKVLNYLMEHPEGITPKDAGLKFGCYRLGARIYELRHDHGYDIETKKEYRKNNDGNIEEIARYILVEKETA